MIYTVLVYSFLQVNGIDMRTLNHFEAVTVLREAADQVTIRVYREPKEVPELQDNYIPVSDGQALSQEGPYGQIKVGFFLCCMCLWFNVPVNSYGHVEMVS